MLEIELVERPAMWLFYEIYEICKKELKFFTPEELRYILGEHIELGTLQVWKGRGHHSQDFNLMSFVAVKQLTSPDSALDQDFSTDPKGTHMWVQHAWIAKNFRHKSKRKKGDRPAQMIPMNSRVVRAMYCDLAIQYPWAQTVGYYRHLKEIQRREDLVPENMRLVELSMNGPTKGVLRRMYGVRGIDTKDTGT